MEVNGQLHDSAALPPGKEEEAGWAPDPVWKRRRRERNPCPYRESNHGCPLTILNGLAHNPNKN